MKVLVTGAQGMLARAVVAELRAGDEDVVALSHRDLDVTDWAAVQRVIEDAAPDAVFQGAAYTGVDAAELDENNALLINATAAGHVAHACQRVGALFVYPSTDYVFSGNSSTPYRPTHPLSPLGAYGRSKAAGETEAQRADRRLIVRTSWLYGSGGRNFVETILNNARIRPSLRIVDDQIGLPTWTRSLAQTLARLLKLRASGTFHAADTGVGISWYAFAEEILEKAGLHTELLPVTSAAYGALAPRPGYSVLDCSETERLLGEPLPSREDSLSEFLRRLGAC